MASTVLCKYWFNSWEKTVKYLQFQNFITLFKLKTGFQNPRHHRNTSKEKYLCLFRFLELFFFFFFTGEGL